jgi:hypothetical protein
MLWEYGLSLNSLRSIYYEKDTTEICQTIEKIGMILASSQTCSNLASKINMSKNSVKKSNRSTGLPWGINEIEKIFLAIVVV